MKKRAKKTQRPKIVSHLCTLVPITDPAEQAEIDRRFNNAIRAVDMYEPQRRKRKPRTKKNAKAR
jgi:hypothetical protein